MESWWYFMVSTNSKIPLEAFQSRPKVLRTAKKNWPISAEGHGKKSHRRPDYFFLSSSAFLSIFAITSKGSRSLFLRRRFSFEKLISIDEVFCYCRCLLTNHLRRTLANPWAVSSFISSKFNQQKRQLLLRWIISSSYRQERVEILKAADKKWKLRRQRRRRRKK